MAVSCLTYRRMSLQLTTWLSVTPLLQVLADGLLDLIRRKIGDDEVVSSNARTVKAALKTSDHTDLAKFHALAVKDFGDDALTEVEDFRKQPLSANKPAHDSWLRAFTDERPGDAERMMLADGLGEDDLRVGAGNDTLQTGIQGGLNEETVGIPPRKPEAANRPGTEQNETETVLKDDLAALPEFEGIDLEFVHDNEGGLRTDLNIPIEEGKSIGKSGATVGFGVDLGQMDAAELQRLGDQRGLSQELIDKLKPYTDKIKEEAVAFLKANPLTISEKEARKLSTAKYTDTMEKLRRSANKHLKPHSDFDNLPDPVKTVVYDLAIHHGPEFLDTHKRFRARLQEGIPQGMIDELRNYYDDPENVPENFVTRRNVEADKLEELLKSWQS